MRLIGKVSLTTGLLVAGAAIGYYLHERNSEQPDFALLAADGDFQLREYPRLIVAETLQPGSRKVALNRGFQALAAYIFAKSRGGAKIPMTAPVVQDRQRISMTAPVVESRADGNGNWRTRFIMPSKYRLETLPEPAPGVSLRELPPRKLAVVTFTGSADDQMLETREADLRSWLATKNLEAAGPAEYAFYNSPFIPSFLRHNEIFIPVADVRDEGRASRARKRS